MKKFKLLGKMIREQPEDFCTDGFKKFVQHWRCYIELKEQYMGK
jgi:hypothetical protein